MPVRRSLVGLLSAVALLAVAAPAHAGTPSAAGAGPAAATATSAQRVDRIDGLCNGRNKLIRQWASPSPPHGAYNHKRWLTSVGNCNEAKPLRARVDIAFATDTSCKKVGPHKRVSWEYTRSWHDPYGIEPYVRGVVRC